MKTARSRPLCRLAFLSMLFCPLAAHSETVSLELRDGGFTISGKLLSFDGDNYVVDSSTLGTLMVSAEKFRCVKGDCPDSITSTPQAGNEGLLRLAGAASIGNDLMPVLIRKYAASKSAEADEIGAGPKVSVDLMNSGGEAFKTVELAREGAGPAFTALEKGAADIVFSAEPINDAQIGQLARAGHFDMDRVGRQHVIGLDALTVVVSRQNPISALSLEDLSRIFSGEATDWAEFGLQPGLIAVHSRNEEAATLSAFRSLVLGPYKRTLTGDAIVHETGRDLALAVAEDPGGIGFASFSDQGAAKTISIKDTCGITHRPTSFSIKSGEYPLTRELYFYTTQIVRQDIADFVGFATSEDGQAAVEEAGFVARGIATARFDEFSGRVTHALVAPPEDFDLNLMRQLAQDLRPGTRLSATIRFEGTGEVQINSESSQQLSPIISYMTAQDLGRHQILLAGYSDSTGMFQGNLTVSLQRANAVRAALLAPGRTALKPDDILVKAYGELFPVACNDTSEGRSKNRRVEVWLVPRRESPVVLNRQP